MLDKSFLSKIAKEFEDGGLYLGASSMVNNWVSTGNFALNKAISGSYHKGLPFQSVADIFGDPSTGKSLLIYHVLANVQKIGGIAILDDTEDAYIKEFGEKIGINNEEIQILNSLTVEEHFEKVFLGWKDSKGKAKKSLIDLIIENEPNCPIVVALDSVALLSTRHEQQVQFEKPDMAKAKMIRAGLRMASDRMKKYNILHLISNHVTSKIGVMYGPKTTTPGGSGIPFSASVRIELSKGSKIKDKNEKIVGIQSNIEITKNKVSAPFKEVTLDIYFEKGVDVYSGSLPYLIDDGAIKDTDGKYSYGETTFRGEQKCKEFIGEHPELFEEKGLKLS